MVLHFRLLEETSIKYVFIVVSTFKAVFILPIVGFVLKEYNLIDILMLSSGVYYQTTILNCRQPDARIRKCFLFRCSKDHLPEFSSPR
jgi:hypothetical protein